MRRLALVLITFLFAPPALAACCDVVRTSEVPPESVLRICEIAPTGACQSVLFEGPLATGASVNVCTTTAGISWDVPDGEGGYSEPGGAVCDGTDIEI